MIVGYSFDSLISSMLIFKFCVFIFVNFLEKKNGALKTMFIDFVCFNLNISQAKWLIGYILSIPFFDNLFSIQIVTVGQHVDIWNGRSLCQSHFVLKCQHVAWLHASSIDSHFGSISDCCLYSVALDLCPVPKNSDSFAFST